MYISELVLCLIPGPLIVIMLLTSAERCKTVGSKVGSLLHEIPKIYDRELYDVVYCFSMQIKQQPMQLEAYSMINIDYSLIIRVCML